VCLLYNMLTSVKDNKNIYLLIKHIMLSPPTYKLFREESEIMNVNRNRKSKHKNFLLFLYNLDYTDCIYAQCHQIFCQTYTCDSYLWPLTWGLPLKWIISTIILLALLCIIMTQQTCGHHELPGISFVDPTFWHFNNTQRPGNGPF